MRNILLIQPKSILKKFYPKAVWNLGRTEKTIYLTFDDGPIPGLTEWVLEELHKYQAKATFFCVGANILRQPQIFEKIKLQGHVVANHTMNHIKGFKNNVADYMKEAEECKKLIGNNLFRPPYGQLKRGQYKALTDRGYRVILWDVISYDYENITPENCSRNVINNARNGSIVLFHDNLKAEINLKHTLPLFLAHFSERGFQFKTLDI
ncbi:MAG: polysaccharide deacetylase family protein [Bacteroidota bacterium]